MVGNLIALNYLKKNIKQLNFSSPIRAIVKTSSGEVLVGEDNNYSIEE